MKTSHVQIFIVFKYNGKNQKRKQSAEKKWGSPNIQQKYSHSKLTQRLSALYFVEFQLGAGALEIQDVVGHA